LCPASDWFDKRHPTHPGAVLREDVIPGLAVTQRKLAELMGVYRLTLSQLLHQQRALVPDIAVWLEKLLGTSAESWLRMQESVGLCEARQQPERLTTAGGDRITAASASAPNSATRIAAPKSAALANRSQVFPPTLGSQQGPYLLAALVPTAATGWRRRAGAGLVAQSGPAHRPDRVRGGLNLPAATGKRPSRCTACWC
jgi:antitoxin HigA-1